MVAAGHGDERQIVRFGDEMKKSEPDVRLDEASLKHDAAMKQQQDEWLKQRGLQ
jgi:hypothetical protein